MTDTVLSQMFNDCDTELCIKCGTPHLVVDEHGVCNSCRTLAHNLRLMAAGITRDRNTGRYTKI